MRWVLFWVFLAIFSVTTLLTVALVFLGFGQPLPDERIYLFRAFLGEVGVSVIALFYALFGLQSDEAPRPRRATQAAAAAPVAAVEPATVGMRLTRRWTLGVSMTVVAFGAGLAGNVFTSRAATSVNEKYKSELILAQNQVAALQAVAERLTRMTEDSRKEITALKSELQTKERENIALREEARGRIPTLVPARPRGGE